jgi:hypothetical protein
MCATTTHTFRVPAFNNLSNDSSPDVREAPSSTRMMEKPVSLRVRCLVSFCALASQFLPRALITSFADPTHLAPSLDLPLESLDKDLEYCLHRVSFGLPPHFYAIKLILISFFISQALALSKKQREKRVAELAQVAKIAELQAVARSEVDRIAEFEAACTDLKCEKIE